MKDCLAYVSQQKQQCCVTHVICRWVVRLNLWWNKFQMRHVNIICLYCFIEYLDSFLYASARYKQLIGESFPIRICSLLCRMCDTIRLVPVRFCRTGHGLVVRTLSIIAGGGVALRLWGPRSKSGSSTWSNSLTIGNYAAASARNGVSCFLHTNIIQLAL